MRNSDGQPEPGPSIEAGRSSSGLLSRGCLHKPSRRNQTKTCHRRPASVNEHHPTDARQEHFHRMLTLKKMTGDGNCFFHALADRSEENGMHVRSQIIQYLQENAASQDDEEQLEAWFQEAEYLESNTSHSGGDTAIIAFSLMRQQRVILHWREDDGHIQSNEGTHAEVEDAVRRLQPAGQDDTTEATTTICCCPAKNSRPNASQYAASPPPPPPPHPPPAQAPQNRSKPEPQRTQRQRPPKQRKGLASSKS